jgi:hypothetical protein
MLKSASEPEGDRRSDALLAEARGTGSTGILRAERALV